ASSTTRRPVSGPDMLSPLSARLARSRGSMAPRTPGTDPQAAQAATQRADQALEAARISGKMSGDRPADSGPGRQPVGGKAAHTCLALATTAHGRDQRAHG